MAVKVPDGATDEIICVVVFSCPHITHCTPSQIVIPMFGEPELLEKGEYGGIAAGHVGPNGCPVGTWPANSHAAINSMKMLIARNLMIHTILYLRRL